MCRAFERHLPQHLGHRELDGRDVCPGLPSCSNCRPSRRVSSTNSRSMRMAAYESAIFSCTIWCSAMTLPCDSRRQRPLTHHVERELALRDGAHRVVDASAAETTLGEGLCAVPRGRADGRAETRTSRVDDVVCGCGGSGWISTPAVLRGTTNMPFVHITKRMSATRPADVNHFSPFDDPVVAVAHGRGLEQVWDRIRPGARSSSRPRTCPWFQQRLQPALLLLIGAEGRRASPCSRCRAPAATEQLRGPRVAADDPRFSSASLSWPKPGTTQLLVEEDRPQPLVLDLLFAGPRT